MNNEIEQVTNKDLDNDKLDFFTIKNTSRQTFTGECVSRDVTVNTTYLNDVGMSSQLVFTVNTEGFMDPYTSYFEFDVINSSVSDFMLDGSSHSMFSEMTVLVNDKIVENYKNYNLIHKFKTDLRMSLSERIERKDEGFATDLDGIKSKTFKTDQNKAGNNKEDNVFVKEVDKVNNKNNVNNDTRLVMRFESVFFGHKARKNNWKLIPMKNIKLQIILKTSNAFGVILPSVSYEKSPKEFGYNSTMLSNIKIKNPVFKFKEYNFNEEYTRIIMNSFERKRLKYDFEEFEVIHTEYIAKVNSNLLLNIKTTKPLALRCLYVFGLKIPNDNTTRRFSFINTGYSKIFVGSIEDGAMWPTKDFFKDIEIYNGFGLNKCTEYPSTYKILETNYRLIGKDNIFKNLIKDYSKSTLKEATTDDNKELFVDDNNFKSFEKKEGIEDQFLLEYKENKELPLILPHHLARSEDLFDELASIKEGTADEIIKKKLNMYKNCFDDIEKKKYFSARYIKHGYCFSYNMLSFDSVPHNNDKVVGVHNIDKSSFFLNLQKNDDAIFSEKPKASKFNLYVVAEHMVTVEMDIYGNVRELR
jgi:hypothetical protein